MYVGTLLKTIFYKVMCPFLAVDPDYLFAFLLLTMFTDKLASLSRDDGHVRGGIFHRDYGLWLHNKEKNKNHTCIQRMKKNVIQHKQTAM